HSYQHEEEEIRQVCQQIRSLLDQHPDANIGIFVPNLEQCAQQISRICSQELAPALSLQASDDSQGDYFNISVGSVLAKQPMIQAAFTLLSLTIKPQLQYQDISELLLNPYIIGYQEEATDRAKLDAYLRAHNNDQLSLQQLLASCQQTELLLPVFQQYLQHLHQQISHANDFSAKHKLSHWVMVSETLLAHFQWHEQASSAHERTQVQNWRDLMQELTALDDFCEPLSWSEALGRLQEYAFEQLFRPAPGQANIQIMGLLEAANLHFDHAFIIGMDELTWPPAAKPHPLIPIDIQVAHQTPHANSEREWVFAQSVWQHLLHVSPDIHISYANTRDHQEVQASPLLQQLSVENISPLPSFRYAASLQQQHVDLQYISDKSIAIAATDSIKGGTGILKAQSACAFQAFAAYRLHLKTVETPSKGLNSSEQGVLLHAALEYFWQQHKAQRNLLILIQQGQLESSIQTCIQQAWSSIHRPIAFAIKALEEKRLASLLLQWLTFESQRPAFKVTNFEVWRDVKLGSKQQKLTLHTKIDRLDSDAEGKRLILDYKTGKSTASKALGERPDEPQLPIYFVAESQLGNAVDGVAFAQVRSFDLSFQGFAQAKGALPNIKAFKGKKDQPQDWHELSCQWQEVLDRLADEFLAGNADVAPKNSPSCQYCDFSGLCRYEVS
ncbi:MAG: PD-(D/E)XK nuclease family protein, partial [Ghiorsea sp.]